MHLDPVGASATKLYMASSFVQGKVEGYVSIQNFDLRGNPLPRPLNKRPWPYIEVKF
jgi:hypothetical protein